MWTVEIVCNSKQKRNHNELDIKNCSCKKRLIGKLLLECKDEILNTI